MLMITLIVGLLTGPSLVGEPIDKPCDECQISTRAIADQIRALRDESWRSRAAATDWLAKVRWQCHPEVVAALTATLQTDDKPKVRARAAEALETMVPNLPTSHLALLGAARSDPVASVRKHARTALATKGLRCVTDCPICGPLPNGAAIVGPQPLWPEWKSAPNPEPAVPAANLPPALPDPGPRG